MCVCIYIYIYIYIYNEIIILVRKWIRQLDFNSWIRLLAFHICLKPLGKV